VVDQLDHLTAFAHRLDQDAKTLPRLRRPVSQLPYPGFPFLVLQGVLPADGLFKQVPVLRALHTAPLALGPTSISSGCP